MFSQTPFVGLRATIWSSLGALLGISAIALLANTQLADADAGLLVGSFGAAAVLLFAAPHVQWGHVLPMVIRSSFTC